LHLLVAGTSEESAFVPFMKLMRQRTAPTFRILRNAFLWQDGYFDRVLHPADHIQSVVDYIRLNPLRARLADKPGDYPFTFVSSKSAELGARN